MNTGMAKKSRAADSLPVLLVDDEVHTLQGYEIQLLGEGIEDCISCRSGDEALEVLSRQEVSLIVLDLLMPGVSGEEVLVHVAGHYPQIPVVVVTGVNEVDTAVQCMKKRAFDYLVEPVDQSRLITTVKRALEFRDLRQENILLKSSVLDRTLKHPEAFSQIITNNDAMSAILKYIESIAGTSHPVLITGETGVGKELIARALHRLSGRSGDLVAVNVAGLDDQVFSDTLFGHKRGAFTSADYSRDGMIEKAAGGTLFLDEIGDLTIPSQLKLLRLLQEKEYYSLGSDVRKTTTARIVVTTNRDLQALQSEERFRADLYYRLVHHHVQLPPLRDRRDDIPLLVEFFLQKAADELEKSKPKVPPELFRLLNMYDFPGNIRELETMIFDAVSRTEEGKLDLVAIEEKISPDLSAEEADKKRASRDLDSLFSTLDHLPTIAESEEQLIQEALRRTNGNRTSAALMLGVSRQTLHRRFQSKNPHSG
jgi:DNA-binding NtrC family response regulator